MKTVWVQDVDIDILRVYGDIEVQDDEGNTVLVKRKEK